MRLTLRARQEDRHSCLSSPLGRQECLPIKGQAGMPVLLYHLGRQECLPSSGMMPQLAGTSVAGAGGRGWHGRRLVLGVGGDDHHALLR